MRFIPPFFAVMMLCLFPFTRLHSQSETASWNLSTRLEVNIPLLPEPFSQYWKTTAGTGLELTWFAGKTTGIILGAHYAPFRVDEEQWIEKFEPKLEGAARLGFKRGSTRLFVGSIGLKKRFLSEDTPFSFSLMACGEYANLYQQKLKAVYVFPEKTLDQELEFGQSQYIYGGCAGVGAEIKLSRSWGIGMDMAYHYLVIQKQEWQSPDFQIRTLMGSSQTEKGFGVISGCLIYYFGYAK